MRFSWSDIEALITSERINGRKLYVGDGSRPNVFVVSVTMNGANCSKDIAQRSVIIKLKRPSYSGNWESDTAAYIEKNRWEIIGSLIAHLRRSVPQLGSFTRWGAWERSIWRGVRAEALQKLILERRNAVDDDEEEASLIREAIMEEIRLRGHGEPDQAGVRIPASVMAEILSTALNDRLSTTAANAKLQMIGGAIPEIQKGAYDGRKIWKWHGVRHRGDLEALRDRPFGNQRW